MINRFLRLFKRKRYILKLSKPSIVEINLLSVFLFNCFSNAIFTGGIEIMKFQNFDFVGKIGISNPLLFLLLTKADESYTPARDDFTRNATF